MLDNGEVDKQIDAFVRDYLNGDAFELSIVLKISFDNNSVFFMRELLGLKNKEKIKNKIWGGKHGIK